MQGIEQSRARGLRARGVSRLAGARAARRRNAAKIRQLESRHLAPKVADTLAEQRWTAEQLDAAYQVAERIQDAIDELDVELWELEGVAS